MNATSTLAEREFAEIGRGTISNDVGLLDLVAYLHQRTLVDAGVLVRALIFHQPVDIDAGLGRVRFAGRTNDDTGGVHLINDAGTARGNRGTRVAGDHTFHASADERRLGA